jgi:pyruvate/2-oxoglutarate dehydrogenase complex dihydrolipoamide acyltransferase (E2) component
MTYSYCRCCAGPQDENALEDPNKAPAGSGGRNETRVKMKCIRLRISERLKEVQKIMAPLATFNKIVMSSLIEMRFKF